MLNNVSFKGVYIVSELADITGRNEYTIRKWVREGGLDSETKTGVKGYFIDTDSPKSRAFLTEKKLDTIVDEYEAKNPPKMKKDHSKEINVDQAEETKVDNNKVIIDCITNIITNASNALREINNKVIIDCLTNIITNASNALREINK